MAEIPSIANILKILLPATFPGTMSEFPEIEAKVFTVNSGAEVLKAIIVRPITILGILSFFASTEALSTSMEKFPNKMFDYQK